MVPLLLGGDQILVVLHLDSLPQLLVRIQEHNLEVYVDTLGQISWFKMLDYLEIQSQLMLNMKSTMRNFRTFRMTRVMDLISYYPLRRS